jgi:hypothetical protein
MLQCIFLCKCGICEGKIDLYKNAKTPITAQSNRGFQKLVHEEPPR